MQSPKLQLYNKVFEMIEGYDQLVVDFKDMTDDLPYPFFVLSDVQERKILDTFNSFTGELTMQIHLWSLADDKGKHDELETQLNHDLSFLSALDDYQLILDDISTNTLIDNTTNQLLLHTIINVEYKVY
ncbi:hypothetical protein [Mammaliicoccus sciuri]|uniref:hypothetical protein n=1 Tax=Mammaliicoccus sciuri TaxID=1296 RepID=UPI001C4EB511|nr:hypothetical protein [Mammaliicoccus sciuri]